MPTLAELESLDYAIDASPSLLIPLEEGADTTTLEYCIDGSPFVIVASGSGGGGVKARIIIIF